MSGFSAALPQPGRVLLTADTVGGVWTYAIELTRALAQHNVEVALATMGAPLSKSQWQEAESLPNLEIFESEYRLEWMEEPWSDVDAAGNWLLDLEQQLSPTTVHLNGYAHGALPFSAPKLVVGHSCVLSWWSAVKGEEAPARWREYRDKVAAGIRNAEHVVAPSRAMLAELKRCYGPLWRADVIPNGRDLPLPVQSGEKEAFVLAAGRLWDEAKGISAVAAIARDVPWPVYVAGDNESPSGNSHQFPGVQWLGKLSASELQQWFVRAPIYALPAKYEPFGLSILEAAIAGCALVLGNIPSLREIWGDAALFVDPNETGNLRQTVTRLIQDEPLRSEMAARARERAAEYSPARMAAGYLAVYDELRRTREPDTLIACAS